MHKFPKSVGVIGTGSYLPINKITNQYFEGILETTDEWIISRTGIKERRKAEDHEATSDLAAKAANIAIKNSGIDVSQIDMIIVATVTPDMAFPSTACLVQKKIGATNAVAFDIEAACSGFIFGLTIAEQFIKNGFYKNILVIGAEVLSRILDYSERNTCVLFGDGAGAAVIAEVDQGFGILSSYIGSDGSQGELLVQPAGGSKKPASFETVSNREHFIKMDGTEVFKFASRIMGQAAKKALNLCELTSENIDCLIPHQANIRIIEAAIKRLNLCKDKVYINLDKYGNMSAASIPVALDEANKSGFIKHSDIVVLVGFGGGLTWGSAVMKWAINSEV